MQKMTQRQSHLQQQYREEVHLNMKRNNNSNSIFDNQSQNSSPIPDDVSKYATKQQREMARLIRLEKQRALEEVNTERQRLKILEKQLNAQLIKLKQDRLEFNRSQVFLSLYSLFFT